MARSNRIFGLKLSHWILIIIAIWLIFFGGFSQIQSWLQPAEIPGTGSTTPPESELTSVTRQVKFTVTDKYAGSSGSGTIYIYAEDGQTLLESGSLSSGTYTTSDSYTSGTVLYVKVNDGSNSILWKKVTVPKMTKADAEAITTNPVKIDFFDICTLTDTLTESATGSQISDGGNWNKTSGGSSVPGQSIATATYTVFVTTDNDGFMSSYDPIYDLDLYAVLWVEVSGTGYTSVVLTGFDGSFEKGTTMYYYKIIPDTGITKWKVGNEYVYSGAWSFSWTVDLSGYSGDSADMQIYVKAYSNPAYMQQYGDYGPYDVELAEQTINLVD